jgi:hypothetical protein
LPPPRKPAAKPFRLKPPRYLEHQLQIDCTTMLRSGVLLPDVCWTAIDHAHSLNMTPGRYGRPIGLLEAQKRRARGVRAGVSDYLFWRLGRGFAIELKTVDGSLSDDQKTFLKEMIEAGIPVSVCWDIRQVIAKLQAWGLCRRVTVMA